MKKTIATWLVAGAICTRLAIVHAQNHPPIPPPDPRYKADILVVVAHPDDDTAISTYLAKAVLDQSKRVAVVFTTRGNSGPNAVGMEQSKALADVREMEARRSLAARGVTNVWFLSGQDTPTQDVLHSLETLGHGEALEEIVRIVRLTRPEVVMTWLPAYVAGENHGDHQASGVVAVEAFDLAGSVSAFPEQLAAPRWHGGTANYGEGLHPWQPKKVYFFTDGNHADFLKGHGPTYLASEMSSARKMTFAEINRLAWKDYATQVDFDEKTLKSFTDAPEYLVLGKSLVGGATDADVWAGVDAQPAAYAPQTAAQEKRGSGVSIELGGPWSFYREFYGAHGLSVLANLVPPQTALSYGNELWLPLLIHNDSDTAADITLKSDLPAGWKGDAKDGSYQIEPHGTYPVQVFLTAPGGASHTEPQTLTWSLNANGAERGKVSIAVYLEFNGVSQ